MKNQTSQHCRKLIRSRKSIGSAKERRKSTSWQDQVEWLPERTLRSKVLCALEDLVIVKIIWVRILWKNRQNKTLTHRPFHVLLLLRCLVDCRFWDSSSPPKDGRYPAITSYSAQYEIMPLTTKSMPPYFFSIHVLRSLPLCTVYTSDLSAHTSAQQHILPMSSHDLICSKARLTSYLPDSDPTIGPPPL